VQRGVCPWLRHLYRLECGGRDLLEAYVGFLELMLFCIRQRRKVELQALAVEPYSLFDRLTVLSVPPRRRVM
jgi:hypothetical protein